MQKVKSNYFLKIAIICIIFIALLFTGILSKYVYASDEYKIDKNMKSIQTKINQLVIQNDELSFSSNPYDYVVENKYYDEIVSMGVSALPIIEEKIHNSKQSGLLEYILAIAAEEIADVDLKDNQFRWVNAKEWEREWNFFLVSIPAKVDNIVKSDHLTIEEKNSSIKKLGKMCLPYLKDAIELGYTDFQPVYKEIQMNKNVNTFSKNLASNKSITVEEEIKIREIIDEEKK